MRLDSCVLAVSLALGTVLAHAATAPASVPAGSEAVAVASAPLPPGRSERLLAQGGIVSIRIAPDALAELGLARIELRKTSGTGFRGLPAFAFSGEGIEIDAAGETALAVAGGGGMLRGGVILHGDDRRFDLSNLRIVVRAGTAPRLDFIDGSGRSLIFGDKLMYDLVDAGRSFRIRSMDLNIGADFAQAVGRPWLTGMLLGEMHLQARLKGRESWAAPKAQGDPNWPGEAAPVPVGSAPDTYKADVFMSTFSAGSGAPCQSCDGPGGAIDGLVKITPSSTLRNNYNNGSAVATVPVDPLGTSAALYAADVPWFEKFTVSDNDPDFNYPYPLFDQHPYLIWNLFRIDPDGRITQIGRSGVKHAFLTTNQAPCDGVNGNHVLGRQCGDTYGVGNNDSSGDLGPRSELIPARGIWARCGSIFDPDCNGNEDFPSGDAFRDRMLVAESALQACRAPASGGTSRCLFESWYVVRDDVNIYNTMATRGITPAYNSPNWTMASAAGDPYRLGSAIDRWAAEVAAGVTSQVVELDTSEGHAKVAVRVRDLGNGSHQYDYAVMNFDFGRAVTTGVESNHTLRVLRNRGFNSFKIAVGPAVTLSQLAAADGDLSASNDWTATVAADQVEWRAPDDGSSLNWGNMIRFSLIANAPSSAANVAVGVTEPDAVLPATYTAALRAVGTPIGDGVFGDGFE